MPATDHAPGAAVAADVPVPADRTADIAAGAIDMFVEYRDQHGHDETNARLAAILEVVEGEAARAEIDQPEEDDA